MSGDLATSRRRVRFIGDAATRIAEDYLRVLRFFRFHAAYGEECPGRGGRRRRRSRRLEQLSRERVRMEMVKLLLARRAVPALVVMTEVGLLELVIGGVPLLADVANMWLEAALSLEPDPVRREGGARRNGGGGCAALRRRLRLANVEYERLVSMGELVAGRVARRAGRACVALSPGAGTLRRPRAGGMVALSRKVQPKRNGAGSRPCRRAGARRHFR